MSVSCTIEARLDSSRLPGKSLYCLGGQPLIEYAISAARESGVVDRVILCTTTRPADDLLVHFSKNLGVECFRGSEEDVAGRVAAAVSEGSDTNIFLTGDNPFVTADLVADSFRQFTQSNADYFCTTHMKYCEWWEVPPALPTGLSVQIAKTRFFLEAERDTSTNDPIRVHSTMVMYKNRIPNQKYQAYCLADELTELCNIDQRYTIDTPADYIWAQRLLLSTARRNLREILKAGTLTTAASSP